MGRISNQIRQLDVAGWGIAALCCGALAVLGANLAGFMPPNLLAGLHATHIQGGSFNQMRAQVAEVASRTTEMDREYAALLRRFNLLADNNGEAGRRLAAVEDSLPLLIEALPRDSDIDRSLLTASIPEGEREGETVTAEGGAVHVTRSDMFTTNEAAEPESEEGPTAAVNQPMPPAVANNAPARNAGDGAEIGYQGVAIDATRPEATPSASWRDIMDRAGSLLLGLRPRIGQTGNDGENGIVLGPLPDLATAQALCVRLERAGLDCTPAPFEGPPLAIE